MRDQQPGALSVLSLRVGLAVAESLPLSRSEVMLKWPNDILLWEKKLGGVLCEAQWKGHNVEWVVVGIGLNVHGPVPADVGPSAVALDEVVRGTTRLGVLDALIPGLKRMGNGPELGLEERAAYARRDWLAGRRLAAPVSGVALGVDPDGSFLVQTHQGVERVVGGTVVTA
jgi:BirA family biotin operon repressor/biotin-[acetyl-CoA-carboxylase] ligase